MADKSGGGIVLTKNKPADMELYTWNRINQLVSDNNRKGKETRPEDIQKNLWLSPGHMRQIQDALTQQYDTEQREQADREKQARQAKAEEFSSAEMKRRILDLNGLSTHSFGQNPAALARERQPAPYADPNSAAARERTAAYGVSPTE
jgi:hypothetical protein